jgi:8-oxo-dGTP pyrophosphatase MutT (NUDIX family)
MLRVDAKSVEHMGKGAISMAPEIEGRFFLNEGATRTQFGALCWRLQKGETRVMLVTSRETGRWIIPKGWPIAGLTPEACALREAWEEAGVEGDAAPHCLGLYPYVKQIGPDRSVPCIVAVYGVRVTRLRGRFPERKERRRAWFSPAEAAGKVDEQLLRDLIAGFSPAQRTGS